MTSRSPITLVRDQRESFIALAARLALSTHLHVYRTASRCFHPDSVDLCVTWRIQPASPSTLAADVYTIEAERCTGYTRYSILINLAHATPMLLPKRRFASARIPSCHEHAQLCPGLDFGQLGTAASHKSQ